MISRTQCEVKKSKMKNLSIVFCISNSSGERNVYVCIHKCSHKSKLKTGTNEPNSLTSCVLTTQRKESLQLSMERGILIILIQWDNTLKTNLNVI